MSAVGQGGKAPDARIQPHRAFRRTRPGCWQSLFEQELNLDPPRLANEVEILKPIQRRQGPPDRKSHVRRALPALVLACSRKAPRCPTAWLRFGIGRADILMLPRYRRSPLGGTQS